MTVSVNPKSIARHAPLGAAALAQLFTEARTHNAFLASLCPTRCCARRSTSPRWAPTAANTQPLRVLFLRSPEAKERLRPALSPGNRRQDDERAGRRHRRLRPRVLRASAVPLPARRRQELVRRQPGVRRTHGVSERHVAGRPISSSRCARSASTPVRWRGFDNAKVDAEFFPDGKIKSNVLINIGYGDDEKLFPRSPRFAFDQMAKVL